MSSPGSVSPELRAPLPLAPRFVQRIWGGGGLPAFHGSPGPDAGASGDPIGESWLADGSSVVTGGPRSGATLSDLATRFGADLLGRVTVERYGNRMALLVKLLDAADDLSVQVHPDDTYALAHESATGHLGKTEAWYVLRAAPDAAVMRGFTRDVTPAEVRSAAADGSLDELLRRLPVHSGDVIVNPAGMVHAVGAGILLYEVQQSSDLTYRLYDYGRVGPDGRPRQLHVDKALEVADLSAGEAELPAVPVVGPGEWRRLVQRPEFVLDSVTVGGGVDARGSTRAEACQVLTVVAGEVSLRWDGDELAMPRGATALLPAVFGDYRISGDGEVLMAAAA